MRKFNSRTLGNLAAQPLAKIGSVIGVDLSVEACARDGNVSEAGVEQVWVHPGIAVNEDAVGGKALGTVTRDGVAVVEMTVPASACERAAEDTEWVDRAGDQKDRDL